MTNTLYAILERIMFLGADLGIPLPGTGTPAGDAPPPAGAGEVVTQVVNGGAGAPEGGFSMMWMLVIYGGIFVAMYFIFFRPQRKREKRMKEMQSAITTGDNIITSGGLFGKIADIGEDCFIVDFGTNRSIRIPVLKADVVGVREPKMTPPPKEITAD